MAIPDSPLTRSEEYLNNIATGEGVIPDVPLTRIEQYLDYIAKNGSSGGGGSGGGGEPFVITGTFNEGSEKRGTVDKTDAEISAAIAQNKTIVFDFIPFQGANMRMFITGIVNMSGVTQLLFPFLDDGAFKALGVQGGQFQIYT